MLDDEQADLDGAQKLGTLVEAEAAGQNVGSLSIT